MLEVTTYYSKTYNLLPPVMGAYPPRFEPRWGFPRLRLGRRSISVLIPLWNLAVLLIAIHVGLRGLRARYRHSTGYCTCCGYNLRGNVSGICPECGTPICAPAESSARRTRYLRAGGLDAEGRSCQGQVSQASVTDQQSGVRP